jgi:translocation protein SEC66
LQANGLHPNWGQTIFQSANEIAANNMFRTKLSEVQAQTEAEKMWWEKRRASIQSEFMKELDAPSTATPQKTPSKANSDDDSVLVEGGGPAASSQGSIGKKKGKKSGF